MTLTVAITDRYEQEKCNGEKVFNVLVDCCGMFSALELLPCFEYFRNSERQKNCYSQSLLKRELTEFLGLALSLSVLS